MKKNILVTLVLIGVIGLLVYLLKDRLKALLGERPTRVPSPEMEEKRLPATLAETWLGLKPWVQPQITMPDESPAQWLQEDIAPVLEPLYPIGYKVILKRMLAFLLGADQAEWGATGYIARPTRDLTL